MDQEFKSLIQASWTKGGKFELLQWKQEGCEPANLASECANEFAVLQTQRKEQELKDRATSLTLATKE